MKEELTELFEKFKINAEILSIESNEIATSIELRLFSGTKLSKLTGISTEIALALKTKSLPLIKPVTEKGIVCLEFLNMRDTIVFDNHVASLNRNDMAIPLALGIGRDGKEFVVDLQKMPHLLIAGETGSGKSIMLHAIINSIIEKSKDKLLYLVDPKRVEFSAYRRVKCVKKLGLDTKDCKKILDNAEREMYKRLNKFKRKGVANILEYREKNKSMDFFIIVIDELATVINKQNRKEIDPLLASLTQLGRAAGIHLVAATQRPSVDVVKGVIKANFPARISCKVASKMDSRVILDKNGAETLCGDGDAIIVSGSHDGFRFKGYFLDNKCIKERSDANRGGWFS